MKSPSILQTLALLLAAATPSISQGTAPQDGERIAAGTGLFSTGASRPAWSTQGDWIAYDKRGADGYSDLYIAHPDGDFDRCLTCELPAFADQHAGNAAWHPSGEYLIFHAERPFKIQGEPLPYLAVPGRNRGDSLWVITLRGNNVWSVVDRAQYGGRVHSPHFSFEGDRVTWSERIASEGSLWGDWVVRVGEFRASRGVPRVTGVSTLEPAAQKAFYEPGGFMPDDRQVLLAGNLIEGQPVDGLDLYAVAIEGHAIRQLTKSVSRWERFPALAPDGRTLVWSSNEGMRRPPRPLIRSDTSAAVPMDLWVGALDGSWSRKLTGFNDPLSEEYAGAVMVGPVAWSPLGDRLLVTVTPIDSPSHSDIFVLHLNRRFAPRSSILQ